jgi:uncharacterized protein YjbI with pentapeptide repeats
MRKTLLKGLKLDNGSFKHSFSLVLRRRHLEGAVLTSADLRKVDLNDAQLQGASLVGAQAQLRQHGLSHRP